MPALEHCVLGESFSGLTSHSRMGLSPPWPDLVVAAGRRTAPVARKIRSLAMSDSKKCFLHVLTKSRKSKRKIEQPIMYVGVYMAYGESGFFIWTLVQFFCKSMLQFYWTACICNLAMKLPHTSLILCIFFQSGPSQNGWPSPLWISPGDQFHRGG